MILRLSQKMCTKIKISQLAELPVCSNPYADWSCHAFHAGRTQYVILMNTPSYYSCLLAGKGINNASELLTRAKDTIGGFMADDGQQFLFSRFVAPSFTDVQYAKPLNRSAIGSMNDHIHAAKFAMARGVAAEQVGYELNETPMSALIGLDGKQYGFCREVFIRQAKSMA